MSHASALLAKDMRRRCSARAELWEGSRLARLHTSAQRHRPPASLGRVPSPAGTPARPAQQTSALHMQDQGTEEVDIHTTLAVHSTGTYGLANDSVQCAWHMPGAEGILASSALCANTFALQEGPQVLPEAATSLEVMLSTHYGALACAARSLKGSSVVACLEALQGHAQQQALGSGMRGEAAAGLSYPHFPACLCSTSLKP